MNLSRLTYRSRQFWQTFLGSNSRIEIASLRGHLTPAQIVLFQRMHPSEQQHALRVMEKLIVSGHAEADLLSAALLHDVGKILSPLSVLDRMLIVLGKHFFPTLSRRWGRGSMHGLCRPFVVAEYHAEWGSNLAAQAGASPVTVNLIARHQEPPSHSLNSQADQLLAALQAADDLT